MQELEEYNYEVYDFLELAFDKQDIKLAGIITYKQVVSLMNSYGWFHVDLIEKLENDIFYNNDDSYPVDLDKYVMFFLTKNDFSIYIPDKITIEQYDKIIEIVNDVKKYEEDYNIKIFDIDYNEFVSNNRKKVTSITENNRYGEENIIGESIISSNYTFRL